MITISTSEDAEGLRSCFVSSVTEGWGGDFHYVSGPEAALLLSRLATATAAFMLYDSRLLRSLPGVRAVVLRFLPYSFRESVADALRAYLAESDCLHIEGFVRFRLRALSLQLDRIILQMLAGMTLLH